MDFEEILDSIRDGRWLVPISIGILVIAVGVVLAVAWPQIKPKPRPQAQSLSTVVTDAEKPKPAKATAKPVPKAIVQQISEDLGEDANQLTVHWKDAKSTKIIVRLQESALKWHEYTYVEQDGRWVQE